MNKFKIFSKRKIYKKKTVNSIQCIRKINCKNYVFQYMKFIYLLILCTNRNMDCVWNALFDFPKAEPF